MQHANGYSTGTIPASPWAVEREELAAAFGSNAEHGLSAAEAARRLAQSGPNTLREAKRRSRLVAFLTQFADWMIGLLGAAAAVSASIGEWPDALLIAAIVVANGVIGFVQEQKAERAVAALSKLSQPMARVWREGGLAELPAEQLVPGDLIELRAGDLAPADARLISVAELQVDESPLTGESMPVDKQVERLTALTPVPDRANMVHAGTAVNHGVGKAIVTATGMQTELGKIASLLETADVRKTPLQERLQVFTKRLAAAIIAVCAVVFITGMARGDQRPAEMFLVAVSLAVAAIPEGLPAVITIALALGSQRMSRRHAIVRQLSAVETLGSVNVICSDKTGTLTQNKMSVSEWVAWPEQPSIREELVRAAALCNDAQLATDGQPVGSATEAAMLSALLVQLDVQQLRDRWPRLIEFPFDSQRKRMSTVHDSPSGKRIVYVKGAAETILDRCTRLSSGDKEQALSGHDRQRLEKAVSDLASRGRRVLMVARRIWSDDSLPNTAAEAETDLAILGFIGIVDPPRPEAREAIARCRTAGIRPVMITGDHQQTALAVAEELALWEPGSQVIDGVELERLQPDELQRRVGAATVFARVSPEHKLRIVRAYQAAGSVVSMTGDGVNDAPALKQADIGVAMGITGTDVSKEAARMVLADDNFATIVAAVEEGRVVYDNIRKFIQYLLTANLSEILVVFLAIAIGLPLPLLPVQLLWINLVTDGLPALALAYERADEHVMRRRPRRRGEGIFGDGLARDIVIFGALMGGACLALYAYFLLWQPRQFEPLSNLAYARTATFFALAMFQLWYVLGLRSQSRSILHAPPWENWRLMGAFVAGTALQVSLVYVPFLQPIFHTVPLDIVDLVICILFSATVLVAFELVKFWRVVH